MKATEFEFRQRFWLTMLLFWGGFWLYGLVDHRRNAEPLDHSRLRLA
ncbi:MAG TPA: hypothetical protein VMD77_10315 [Candidatus Baltobacteraceae bacterium]|nr:hypothetical protein [Candidatus Baltobacteraceae bacterium]